MSSLRDFCIREGFLFYQYLTPKGVAMENTDDCPVGTKYW